MEAMSYGRFSEAALEAERRAMECAAQQAPAARFKNGQRWGDQLLEDLEQLLLDGAAETDEAPPAFVARVREYEGAYPSLLPRESEEQAGDVLPLSLADAQAIVFQTQVAVRARRNREDLGGVASWPASTPRR